MTPEELERYRKRETIAHDDETSYSTRGGAERWEAYRVSELERMQRERVAADLDEVDLEPEPQPSLVQRFRSRLLAAIARR